MTDPMGFVTRTQYNLRGLPVDVREAFGTTLVAQWLLSYATNDDLLQITDPSGRLTNREYDGLGRVKRILENDPDGAGALTRPEWLYQYDVMHRITRETDPRGAYVEYAYLPGQRLEKIRRSKPDGTAGTLDQTITYGALGLPTRWTDSLGRQTDLTLDNVGRVLTLLQPDPDAGGPRARSQYQWTYDALDRPLTATSPVGAVDNYTYKNYGTTIELQRADPDAGGPQQRPKWTSNYNVLGELQSSIDPLNAQTLYSWDAIGRLTLITEPDPDGVGPLTSPITQQQYNKRSERTALIDPLGRTSTWVIDARGRVTSFTAPDPDGAGSLAAPQWQYQYNLSSELIQQTDPLSAITTFTRDGLGRATQIRLPNPTDGSATGGPLWQQQFDAVGNLTQTTNPLSAVTKSTFDLWNRLTKLERPDPVTGAITVNSPTTQWFYDSENQLLTQVDALGQSTSYSYTLAGELLEVLRPDPDGAGSELAPRLTYSWDAAHRLTGITDRLGYTQTQVFDPLDRVIEQKNELNQSIFYQYDAANRLTQLKDANNNATNWTFDTLGRQLTETDPGGFVTTSSYDAVGNLTRQVDRRGKVIDFGYDGLDRRVTETWRDTIGGAAVKTLGFSYNSIDQLLTASDGGVNKLVRTYDKLGRLKTDEQIDAKGLLTYSYDAASNKTLTALAINGTSDLTNAYSFDKLGRMTAIEQSGGGSRQKRAEFAYDKLDRQTGITRKEHNGTSLVTISTTAQAFDFAGRLTSLQHYGINTGIVLAGYTLNWDAGDRIESITSVADGLVTYSYDATDQLLAANYTLPALPDETYSFDALGNRNSSGYTTGTGNLTSADATYDYTYDQEGNRTLRVERSTGKRTEYTWDHRQRLVEIVTRNTAGGAVTSRVQYQYDPLDQRVGKDIDATGDGTFEKRERFIHEDGEVLAVVNISWQRLNRYLHGPLVDQVLAEEVVNPANGQATQVNWLLGDHLGTIRDVARYAAGSTTVIDHIFLSSFGVEVSHSAADPGHRFGFTGRDRDLESDLDYYRARYYDPRLGRFISQDPIGFEANDPNVQRYVGNSVTLATDPSGREMSNWDFVWEFFGYSPRYDIGGPPAKPSGASALWNIDKTIKESRKRIDAAASEQSRQGSGLGCSTPERPAGDYAGVLEGLEQAEPAIEFIVEDGYLTFVEVSSGMAGSPVGVRLRIPNGSAPKGGLASNPFQGKTPQQIDDLLTSRGFKKVGPDPMNGKGSYFHPETGRKYYCDPGGVYKPGTELPHVDVHRMIDGKNIEGIKRKYPLGDKLYE